MKRARMFWSLRETAKGFIQHTEASSSSGLGKGSPTGVGRGGSKSHKKKKRESGTTVGHCSKEQMGQKSS